MYCTVRMLADSRQCPLTDNIKKTGLQKGLLDEWVDGHG